MRQPVGCRFFVAAECGREGFMILRDTGCVGRGGERFPAKGTAARSAAAAAADYFPRR
jgi:hypothetical protein